MRALATLVALLAVVLAASAGAAGGKTVTVSITHSAFVPKDAKIAVGDAVTWVNNDTANHQIVSQSGGGFSSPVLKPGESFSHTFTAAGKVSYHDAFVSNLKGTVTVTALPLSVTITASPPVVVYANATTLSGTASTQETGLKVTVLAQPCGQAAFASIGSMTTTTGGAWTLAGVKPTANTVYQAKAKNVSSPAITVKVAPRLRLAKLAAHRYSLRVLAAQSFAGKIAVFQRYAAATGKWVRVRYVTLKTVGTGVAPTVISGATFRSSIKARLRVRAVLGQAMAGSCYLAGKSNVIRS